MDAEFNFEFHQGVINGAGRFNYGGEKCAETEMRCCFWSGSEKIQQDKGNNSVSFTTI